MPSDAARLEATGATEVTFEFRGRAVTIPLDVGAWPAALVRFDPLVAVLTLLGDEARRVLGPGAVLDDARELSNAMAAAVGVAMLPEDEDTPDQWFGRVQTLLRLVDEQADDIELDLRRIGVDYRDRWRGTLTLRQVWVYVRRSLSTSAIAVSSNYGKHVWDENDYIGASVYQALTGKVYPGRPLKPEELAKALEAMQAKADHVDKLRDRQAHYAAPADPPPVPLPGLSAAMAEAIANRRHELGETEPNG